MELVVDTNILYTYFWKDSFTKKIILSQDIKLHAPEFSLIEINKYKADIIKKTKISEKEFENSKIDIAISVNFMPEDKYSAFLKKSLEISPDSDDIDFFSLCLKLNLPLWSNDSRLKKQNKVPVFSTKDLFDKFFEIVFPED